MPLRDSCSLDLNPPGNIERLLQWKLTGMARKRGTLAEWIADAALPIMVLDRRQRIRVFNRGASLTTGFAPGDVLGRRCEHAPDAKPGSPEAMLDALAVSHLQYQGSPETVDVVFSAKNLATVRRSALFVPLESGDADSQLLVILSTAEVDGVPPAEALIPPATLRSAKRQHSACYGFDGFVAASSAMTQVSRQIQAASRSMASVWIQGRSGTGRTRVAEIIQSAATDRDGVAITIDARLLTAKPLDDVLASLFSAKAGMYLLNCESLTEWSSENQQLLATAISDCDANVQLISTATTNEPSSLIPELSRIAADLTIRLPRLRDRGEDVVLLAQHFLERTARYYTKGQYTAGNTNVPSHEDALQPISFSEAALLLLQRYSWPGEVVQLEKTIQQATAACQHEIVDVVDLPSSFRSGRDADQLVPVEPLRPLEDVLREVEKNHVQSALRATSGEKSRAAKLLGMSRPKLYRRMEELGINDDREET